MAQIKLTYCKDTGMLEITCAHCKSLKNAESAKHFKKLQRDFTPRRRKIHPNALGHASSQIATTS